MSTALWHLLSTRHDARAGVLEKRGLHAAACLSSHVSSGPVRTAQCIGRKNELYTNLKAYCEREKFDVHSMAPPTFIVSAGEACSEFNEFARICKAMENKIRIGPGKNGKPDGAKGPASPAKGTGGKPLNLNPKP